MDDFHKLALKYFDGDIVLSELKKALAKSYMRIVTALAKTTSMPERARLRTMKAEIEAAMKEMYDIPPEKLLSSVATPYINDLAKTTSYGISWAKLPDVAIAAILDPNKTENFIGMSMTEILKDESIVHARKVRNAVAQGIIEGESVDVIAAMVRSVNTSILNRHLNTIARTMTAEAMSRSNMEIFKRSDEVLGYEYSAKLDSRTTEFCRKTDNRQWLKRNGWTPEKLEKRNYWPPTHWNCRSVMVPIV